MIGTSELLIIGVVVLVLFGGAQLPKLAKSLGKFIQEFETAKKDSPKKSSQNKK